MNNYKKPTFLNKITNVFFVAIVFSIQPTYANEFESYQSPNSNSNYNHRSCEEINRQYQANKQNRMEQRFESNRELRRMETSNQVNGTLHHGTSSPSFADNSGFLNALNTMLSTSGDEKTRCGL